MSPCHLHHCLYLCHCQSHLVRMPPPQATGTTNSQHLQHISTQKCTQKPTNIETTDHGVAYSEAANPLNKAVIRSSTNQEKEYENKIKKLHHEVMMLGAKLDNMQMRLLQLDVYRERNVVTTFGKFDHSNSELLQAFARIDCPPSKNSLSRQCWYFRTQIRKAFCVKLNELMKNPREVVTQMDIEYFWSNTHTVPIINKKYCEIGSIFNAEIKKVYIVEWNNSLIQNCTVLSYKSTHMFETRPSSSAPSPPSAFP